MKKQKGQILVISTLFLSVIVLLVAVLAGLIIGNNYTIQKRYQQKVAFNLAEAGLDKALQQLNINPVFSGEILDWSNGTIETAVVTISSKLKQVESIGYYPNKTNAKTTKKVRTQIELNTSDVAFHYGVQVGLGGLEMKNNAAITGNIYSDGNINGSAGAKISGGAWVATGMSPDNNWLLYKGDGIFGKNNVNDIAQSFRANSTGPLSQIAFYIKKYSNPNDKTIYVVTDNGSGSPSKTVLAQTPLYTDRIVSDYDWVNYTFSSPPNVTAGTWYWIIIDTSSHPTQYFSIGKDTDKGNGNGVSKWSQDWNAASPVWTEDDGDFNFKTWIGGQPNFMNSVQVDGDAYANTITNSQICGNAYYQSIDAISLNFLNTPLNPPCPDPLTSGIANPNSPDPPQEAMPISAGNISAWENEIPVGNTYSDAAHCSPTSDITIGPAKLLCDFTPTGGITITLSGTLWVVGNLTLDVGTIVQLAPGYGETSGIIIADNPAALSTSGQINVGNNVKICGSTGYNTETKECNDPGGSYTLILSTHTGTGSPTHAVSVANNSDSAIFYASAGSAYIAQNAVLKEVTAYKLIIENNATVNYSSGLANTKFSSGPGASWAIKKGTWQEL